MTAHDLKGYGPRDPLMVEKQTIGSRGIPHLPKPGRYPYFLYAVPKGATCTAFIKESRMEFLEANQPHRKYGVCGTHHSLPTEITPLAMIGFLEVCEKSRLEGVLSILSSSPGARVPRTRYGKADFQSTVAHGRFFRLRGREDCPSHERNQDPGHHSKQRNEDVGKGDVAHLVRLLRRWLQPALRWWPWSFHEAEAAGSS